MQSKDSNLSASQAALTQIELDFQKNKMQEELKSKPRVKLDFLSAFGIYTGSSINGVSYDVQNCLSFLEEADLTRLVLAYPVGRHIGIRDLKTNEMKFIRQHEQLKELTALCLSPNKKFLASCEVQRDDKAAYITFYDMKSSFFKNTQNQINVCEGQTPTNQRYVTSLAFSADSKYISCLLNVPDCRALAYEWFKKNRVIASYEFHKQEINKISFHPKDNHKVCTSGNGQFQLWNMQEGTFKQLQEFKGLPKSSKMDEEVFFTDHLWTDEDHLLGCTKSGDLFAIEVFEVFQTLPFDGRAHYTCLRAFSHGFAAATDDGHLSFFRWLPERKRFELVRKWTCTELKGYRIISMTVYESAKDEVYMAIASRGQNIVYLNVMKHIFAKQQDQHALGIEDVAAGDEVAYETVAKGFHQGGITCMDMSIQRPIVVTCSREDCTIRFWNYYTGQCELSRRYFVLDKGANDSSNTLGAATLKDQVKPLLTLALHPSGYYMAAGFIDRVRILHVLHDELRDFRTLEHKSAYRLKFSNGGHYLVVVEQKNFYIYASYTLECLAREKCPSQSIANITFSEGDTRFVMTSNDGFLYVYDLVSFTKKIESKDRNCDLRAAVFMPQVASSDPKADEKYRVLAIGSENQKALFRLVNQREDQELNALSTSGVKKFTDICLLKSFTNNIENLLVGTDRGSLKIFSPQYLQYPTDYCFESFSVHLGETVKVLASPDGRFVFSAGADGSVFVFSVTEYANEQTILKQEVNVTTSKDEQLRLEGAGGGPTSQLALVVDEQLAQIVMVKKSVMEQWRKKQEQLKQEMEEENNKVESSLRHEKYKYEQHIADMEKTKTDELNDLNKRYEDLQMQEAEQKDENTQTMKKMELNHLQCMEELQTLYEKKLAIENMNYTRLEKEKGEMKMHFEGEIKLLQRQNEEAIEKLLNEFKLNLGKVQDEYEDQKKTADGLKTQYEEKLTQQEDEHEAEISELKGVYRGEREQLEDVIGTLKNDIETIKRQIKRIIDERDQFQKGREYASEKKKKLKVMLEEKKVVIKGLEEEKKEVQEKLKKKESELYKYKFKIKDLQKTKQVLTHRTQEMKASLEPKEQQIENLKEQLLDLEKVFEKQSKAMQNLKDDVDRRQSKIEELQNFLLKEKNQTKTKEKTIQSFVNDIHKIVQHKDEKLYVTGLMKIYEHYVKKYSDEILEKKKKDPETIEELDRQLKYMEKSIGTLKQNTSKNDGRAKSNIKKKTKENSELIKELQDLRQRKVELEAMLKDKDRKLEDLKIEKLRRQRENEKKRQSQHQHSVKNDGQYSQQYYTRPKSGSMRDEGILSASLANAKAGGRGGKVYKGTPFNYLKGSVEDKSKIQELMSALEDNNQQILLQKLEIRALKDKIVTVVHEKGMQFQQQQQINGNQNETSIGGNGGGLSTTPGGGVFGERGNTPGTAGQQNMRIGAKMNKEKESFLPRVDSRQNL